MSQSGGVDNTTGIPADSDQNWELCLYVTDRSPKCLLAIENLRRVCEENLAGRYRIEVVDLLENPRLAADDQILAVPTVVRRLPAPIRKLVGDLSDTERLLVGLQVRAADQESTGHDAATRACRPLGADPVRRWRVARSSVHAIEAARASVRTSSSAASVNLESHRRAAAAGGWPRGTRSWPRRRWSGGCPRHGAAGSSGISADAARVRLGARARSAGDQRPARRRRTSEAMARPSAGPQGHGSQLAHCGRRAGEGPHGGRG